MPRGSAYGMRPLGGRLGRRAARRAARAVRRRDARRAPRRLEPAAVASVADNVADGYRTVAGPLAAAPGEEVLIAGGAARSVGLYAVACAVALGAARVVYADTDEGRLERAAALGAEPVAVDRMAGEARPLPDHGRRHRRPRRTALRAPFDRARRRVHERGDLLRAGHAAPAAGDVHPRLHAAHQPRPRPRRDPRRALADRGGAAGPGAGDERGRRASTMPSPRSPNRRRSSSSCHDRVPPHRRLQLRRRPLRGDRAATRRQLLPLQALPASQRRVSVAQRPSGARLVPDRPGEDRLRMWKPEDGGEKWFCGACGSRSSRATSPTPTRSASGWARSTAIRASARASRQLRRLRRVVGADPRRRAPAAPRESPPSNLRRSGA